MEIVAYPGLCRLRQLPPGFLNTLLALDPSHFGHLVDYIVGIADILKLIYNLVRDIHLVRSEPEFHALSTQCAQGDDDDMANYNRIVRRLSDAFEDDESMTQQTHRSNWPPWGRRYILHGASFGINGDFNRRNGLFITFPTAMRILMWFVFVTFRVPFRLEHAWLACGT